MMNLKLHRSVGYSEQEIQSLSNLSDSLLFELLEAQESFVNNTLKLSKDMLNELALVTAEFFEDIILDIGIWRSLEDYNKKFFNTPLPFFLKPGEELTEENLYKKRIQYLLWNKYSEFMPSLILSPTHRDLDSISNKLAEYIIKKKDSSLLKESSIKSLFNQSDQYGWHVKRKLLWLGQHSYLFRHSYEEYLLANEGKSKISVIDDFVCQNTTRWSGLGVIDILASVLNISNKQRIELCGWYERHLAYYLIKSIQGHLVSAENIISNKKYSIRMGEQSGLFKVGHIYVGSLVQWNKEWYWSGQQSYLGQVSQKMIEKIRSEFIEKSALIVYRYCKSLLERAKERIRVHYQNFVKFHGDDIVIFPDGYSMAASVQKQYRLEYEAGPQNIVKKIMKNKNLKNPWPNYSYPESLLESENGIGLFFNPNEGQEIMREFDDIVNGLKKKGENLSENEIDCIKGFIESEAISPDFVKKMVNKYGSQSIAESYLFRDTENFDFLTYLLKRYKGQYFRNRYPNISFN